MNRIIIEKKVEKSYLPLLTDGRAESNYRKVSLLKYSLNRHTFTNLRVASLLKPIIINNVQNIRVTCWSSKNQILANIQSEH